ncbi:MAG: hypothetical protein ABW167_20075 [Baekduia sp.]
MYAFPHSSAAARHHLVSARLRAELLALDAFDDQAIELSIESCRKLGGGAPAAVQLELRIRNDDAQAGRAVLLVDLLAGGRFPLSPPVITIVEADLPTSDLTAALDAALAQWTPERSSVAVVVADAGRAATRARPAIARGAFALAAV